MVRWAGWWLEFPRSLRLVALVRGCAAVGAGGILFLGPLVFHREGFGSLQIGLALALASGGGLLARGLSGLALDRGAPLALPMRVAALLSIAGDLLLFHAHHWPPFGLGEFFLGLAMGAYWPAADLAVAQLSAPLPSSEGFALARSADALGVCLGALLGCGLAAALGPQALRLIYAVDISGMLLLLLLVRRLPRHGSPAVRSGPPLAAGRAWIMPLLPLLLLALLGSGIISLQQSALPLDMAQGGLARPGLTEAGPGLLIGLQLGLLLLMQWPVGHWLASKPVRLGLRLSLLAFAAGCGLLALSALLSNGLLLLLAAQPLLALASAAFLPSIAEAVVETAAPEHQGLALGLYSQTWALSGIALPPLAGWLLEQQRHGLGLWLLMGGLCLPALALTHQKAEPRARNY
jgi:predicted MFS family arabinose efflux permease